MRSLQRHKLNDTTKQERRRSRFSDGDIYDILSKARAAQRLYSSLPGSLRTSLLSSLVQHLRFKQSEIAAANEEDCRDCESTSHSAPLAQRLRLTPEKWQHIFKSIEAVSSIQDPLGIHVEERRLRSGVHLSRVNYPIGVLGVILESRPDAFLQIVSLALRSGNACIIKAGAEARRTVTVLHDVIATALRSESPDCESLIQVVFDRPTIERVLVSENGVDLAIPRGSQELVHFVKAISTAPVLGHADGICHIYIDKEVDWNIVTDIVINSKTSYPAACNAVETLLVHSAVPVSLFHALLVTLKSLGVMVYGYPETQARVTQLDGQPITSATHWSCEYSALVIAVRIVDSIDTAIAHINEFGSHHTDAILTRDATRASLFQRRVDSANVFHNISTRFSDGAQYEMGAEVGISTSKLHARGPVGINGLLTYKYHLAGDGHTIN